MNRKTNKTLKLKKPCLVFERFASEIYIKLNHQKDSNLRRLFMKRNKLLLGIMSMVLTAAILGGCTNSNSDKTEEEGNYDQVVYAYSTFNNIPEANVLDTVEEEINKITRELINVEVELMPIAIADYSSSVSLSLQGGDKIDIFETLGNFNTSVASGMAYDITDLIDTYAPEAKEIVGRDFLDATTQDGKLYGIPTYKPYALTPMVIYKQEIADELGINMDDVKSFHDLTDVFRKVKEAYPNMTPLVPVEPGNSGLLTAVSEIDYLTDDFYSPKGVMVGDSFEVLDFYATDKFAEVTSLARLWHEEGLILRDAATTTSTSIELMSTDNSFSYIAAYSYTPEDTAALIQAQVGGIPLGAVQIGDAYLGTTSINAVSWLISSNTDVPEAALKFLNLTYSNEDITNLLIYGIEGRDYILSEDGYMSYPEGEDSSTVPYTAQLSSGTLGNYFIMYSVEGTSKESKVWEEAQNRDAIKSPAMGFTFDSDSVKTEYAAVNNLIQQYLPGLITGSVDPDTVIPEFIERLNAAGLDNIIAAKQAQLDAWLELQ